MTPTYFVVFSVVFVSLLHNFTLLASSPTVAPGVSGLFQIADVSQAQLSSRMSQMQFGPDERLYVSTIDAGVIRFDYSPAGVLTNQTQVSSVGSLGIAFHEDAALGTVMYLSNYNGLNTLARITRLNDSDADGVWGETNELNQEIVNNIPIRGHHMNQIQIRGDTLFVGIGAGHNGGTNEHAFLGTVCWIQDLTLLADTTTPNIAALTIGDPDTDATPYTATAADKLIVYANGFRNPYGLTLDPAGTVWTTINQRDENPITPQDEFFKLFHKADGGFPQENANHDFRTDPQVLAAGFFDPANRLQSLTDPNAVPVISGNTKDYDPDDPTPGGIPPGGLGPHSSANGFDFDQANVLPLLLQQDAFIVRFGLHGTDFTGVAEVYEDLVAVDLDTGEVIQIADDFNGPLSVIQDAAGNFLIAEGGNDVNRRIWRLSPTNPIQTVHPFSWNRAADGLWSQRLAWDCDVDGNGAVDNPTLAKHRKIPNAWGTARYAVAIDRPGAAPTVTLDQNTRIETLTLNDQLRLTEPSTLTVTDNLTIQSQGILSGAGAIAGKVINHGTVAPGFSPGVIQVQDDYEQDGLLLIEITGHDPNDYDRLDITGHATLAGTMDLTLDPNFTPQPGHRFDLITAATIADQGLTFQNIPAELQWTIVTLNNGRQALRLYHTCFAFAAADWTEDCRIDLNDLLYLATNWLAGRNYQNFATLATNWPDE